MKNLNAEKITGLDAGVQIPRRSISIPPGQELSWSHYNRNPPGLAIQIARREWRQHAIHRFTLRSSSAVRQRIQFSGGASCSNLLN